MKFNLPKINLVTAVLTAVAVLFTVPTLSKEFISTATEKQVATSYNKQVECLAKNIYYESAGETYEGKLAVAQVTMNRVASGKFAETVCGVVYQKNVFYDKVVCQFSWFCEANNVTKPVHPKQFQESEEVAKMVMLEGMRLPALKEAMYYHADYVDPKWKKEKITQIGRHIFYKEKRNV